jgi:hypothetical protein
MTAIDMKNILFFITLYSITAANHSYAAGTPAIEDPNITVSTTSGVQLLSKSAPIKSDTKSSGNFTSKLMLKHKTSNPLLSGPDCNKAHEAAIRICINNPSYRFDDIYIAEKGRLGLGNVSVSSKDKMCGEILSQIKKDHSGQHPNYKCSDKNPLAIFEVKIKYTN